MRILRFVIAFLLAVLAVPYIAAAQWRFETVDSKRYVGLDTSLALDAGGNPHISYCWSDDTNTDLKYAFWAISIPSMPWIYLLLLDY